MDQLRKIPFGTCFLMGLLLPMIAAANDKGEQAHQAIMANDSLALHRLIAEGVDMEKSLPNGDLPIMAAFKNSNIDLIKVLTGKKVNVKVQDAAGYAPIHYAAISGNIEKIKLLRALKVPVDEQNAEGLTPFYIALIGGHKELAAYLYEEEKAQVNLLDKAGSPLAFSLFERGDTTEPWEYLKDKGLNFFTPNAEGATLLQVAERERYEEVAALLKTEMEARIKAFQDKQKGEGSGNE